MKKSTLTSLAYSLCLSAGLVLSSGAALAETVNVKAAESTVKSAITYTKAQEKNLSDLLEMLSPLKQFSAEFTQSVVDKKQKEIQAFTGDMTIASPNKLLWMSYDPYPQQVISNGTLLWVFDQDLDQVTVQPFKSEFQVTPAMLFSGDKASIKQHFYVEKLKDKKNKREGFVLLPATKNDMFIKLDIVIDNKTKQVTQLIMHDQLQQVTTINLTNIKPLKTVDSALFEFTPPEGVDVLINEQ